MTNQALRAQLADEAWDRWLATRATRISSRPAGWRRLKMQFGWQGRPSPWAARRAHRWQAFPCSSGAACGLTMAYVPRGPLTDWHDRPLTLELLDAIRQTGRKAGAALLKIEPGTAGHA